MVALKRLLRGPASTAQDVERFRAEAHGGVAAAHPHIVPVFQVGNHDGQPFFTMQLRRGDHAGAKAGRWPVAGAGGGRLLVPVCRAIHYAHDHGVLHRDLKPSNILIDLEGNPYVSDFGLAKRIDVDPSLTPSGAMVGTPSYMAPEQAGSLAPGGRSRRRARRATSTAWARSSTTCSPADRRFRPQRRSRPSCWPWSMTRRPARAQPAGQPRPEMIALQCLQKPPALRYPSAAALADDLEAFLRGDPVSARSTSLRALAAGSMGETHHAAVAGELGPALDLP